MAKVPIDIMTKHAYLPTTRITDKGTAFNSTIIAEITQILGITLEYATTKHPQTIGKLERTHASLKTNLKMACGEYGRQWHKYLSLAVRNHNISYHASISCDRTSSIQYLGSQGWIISQSLCIKLESKSLDK